MKIAVAGVSGRTGKRIAEELLAKGHAVRVIVRKKEQAHAWEERGASSAIADLQDVAAVTEALRGVDAAYLLVPTEFGAPRYRDWQDATSRVLAAAVEASRVPRVVLLSSIGAQLASGTGPIVGLHVAEELFKRIPTTTFSFIRAGYFVENFAALIPSIRDGVLPSFVPADVTVPMVSVNDISRLAVQLLVDPAAKTPVVQLGTHRSYADVAGAFAKCLGNEVRVHELPSAAAKPAFMNMGLTEDFAALYAEMYEAVAQKAAWFEDGHRHVPATETLDESVASLL